jgi:hypothetical protein
VKEAQKNEKMEVCDNTNIMLGFYIISGIHNVSETGCFCVIKCKCPGRGDYPIELGR